MSYQHIQFPRYTLDQNKKLYNVIKESGELRKLKKDEILHLQEDPPTQFYFVKSGQLRSYLVSDDGRIITVEIVGEGRLYGLASYAANLPRPCSCSAVVDTELFCLNYNKLEPYIKKDHQIALDFFHLLGDTIYILVGQINNLSFYNAEKRIAHSLLHLGEYYKKSTSDSSYSLNYTHQEIADFSSINRVTANRVLHKFEKNGWVSLKYGSIVISDEQALKEVLLSE